MKSRILLNVLSVFILGAFAVLAAGTSPIEQFPLGEFPLGIEVNGESAYLLHFTTGPFEREPRTNSSLYFTNVNQDGSLSTQDFSVPAVRPNEIAGAVIDSTDGAVGFAIASSSSRGPFSVVVTNTGELQIVPLGTGGQDFRIGDRGSQLSMIKRDTSRQWVFFSLNLRDRSSFLPLFEIENGIASLIGTNVVWAHCNESWCQQVRIEGSRLRLYASPATSDVYTTAVTDVVAQGNGYYAYNDDQGNPLLVFGSTLYALSATAPTLKVKALEIGYNSPPHEVSGQLDRLTRHFPNGGGISMQLEAEHNPSSGFCDAACLQNHYVMETRVEMWDADHVLRRSFALHNF